jgi:NAD(P)-dependent dehydrogenase (short-subunit alcohol dehydrogenase family)
LENESGNHYAYRAAKAKKESANMVGKNLAIDLEKHSIAVGLVHPGYGLTGFQGPTAEKQLGQHDVEPATKGVLDAIQAITMDNTGVFLHKTTERESSHYYGSSHN